MPPPKIRGLRKPKDAKKTLFRILKYMANYKLHLVLVLIGIIFSSIATIAGN